MKDVRGARKERKREGHRRTKIEIWRIKEGYGMICSPFLSLPLAPLLVHFGP
jgi:hypothetical protein